ncbi:DUF4232 domain-containing protein [Glutamicibacter sp. JL.03c]|uniref:DUF4232 domain-containing protein n=1 Tax=Glutamicibacter sp. JL.03c TaxID=2984842 RepID=UPI0021F77317|nr:DUF4232 domain-containing protein [Glutamicibacter sp. JL.03c]UYQ77190.1 DUF4232 domain-containing protein [Glutamicibacter sp. JL.03c]
MKPLRLGTIIAILVLAVAVVLLWKPWDVLQPCSAPEEYCVLASELEHREGIDSAEVGFETTAIDAKDGNSSLASWTVELDESLDAEQAGEIAQWASSRIRTLASEQSKAHSSLRFVAGEPQDSAIPDLVLYPLDVTDSDEVKERIIQAFSLLKLGAHSVGQGSAVARDLPTLEILGDYAAQQEMPVTLALEDSSLRYSSDQRLNTAEFDLALEAAGLDGVDSVVFDSGGLSLHTNQEEDSQKTGRLKDWLSQHAPLDEPVAFTLSSAGYAKVTEGWVGGKLPESLIARPARLPDGVAPWPKDPSAPACAADDVELSLGAPDAAVGSRYMALYAKNISTGSCAIQGYPRIEFRNAQGEQQKDMAIEPMADIRAQRVVIPAGDSVLSALKWKAMSTANDPDETTMLSVAARTGFGTVELTPRQGDSPVSLDILDGGQVDQSPWLQALDGWPVPSAVGQQPSRERP